MGIRKTPKSQYKQISEWKKSNMKTISVAYKKEYVESFRDACHKLGIKQSDVIRDAIDETLKKV